ncbi:MAG: SDR family oxidoreductase [Archangiaceae bacterium]|nr:SDR family oxidoreductase [Archangiaceae bacterium]
MDLGISGRVALVAGASRGIGRAVARALAREGCDVALLARSVDALEAAAVELRGLGRKAAVLPCDLTDLGALREAYERASSTLGPPTLLVLSAAAVYAPKKLHFLEPAEVRAALDTDLASAVELCRLALPAMMDARFGRVVALGSVAARSGVSGGALYAAAKAGLEGLMRGLAVDYSRRGITANVVSVAFADSERLRGRVGEDVSARERLVEATATRRIPTVDEIADVVTFVCSTRAASITGAVVDATAGGHLNNLW